MRLSSRPGGFSLVAGLAATSALAAGCGEQERQRRIPGTPEAEHAAEVARNPYAVTCGDLARQPQHPAAEHLVIQAEFALAREPVLTKGRREADVEPDRPQLYFGLTEVCTPGLSQAARSREPSNRGGNFVPVVDNDCSRMLENSRYDALGPGFFAGLIAGEAVSGWTNARRSWTSLTSGRS